MIPTVYHSHIERARIRLTFMGYARKRVNSNHIEREGEGNEM